MLMCWNRYRRKRCCLNLRHYPEIYLEALRRTTINLRKVGVQADVRTAFSEYKAEAQATYLVGVCLNNLVNRPMLSTDFFEHREFDLQVNILRQYPVDLLSTFFLVS
jgi:hypothetical protein